MSYDTTQEKRDRSIEAILTDVSDIIELDETGCIEYFNNLILNKLHKEIPDLECWIGGGAVRDFFQHGRHLRDIDIYFPDPNHFMKVKLYLYSRLNSRLNLQNQKNISNSNCEKIRYIRESEDINSFFDLKEEKEEYLDIDLIKIHSVSPQVTISNFDFTISSAAVTRDKFFCHRRFKEDLENKELIPLNILPNSILFRLQKMNKYGFSMGYDNLLKITDKFIDELRNK